jgi:hypothetical protein
MLPSVIVGVCAYFAVQRSDETTFSPSVRQCHGELSRSTQRSIRLRSEFDQRRQTVTADDAQPVFIPAQSGKVLDFLASRTC